MQKYLQCKNNFNLKNPELHTCNFKLGVPPGPAKNLIIVIVIMIITSSNNNIIIITVIIIVTIIIRT